MTKRLLSPLLTALALGAAPIALADSAPIDGEESILDAPDPVPQPLPAELATPADVAAPPANATRLPSGLAFRVLKAADGTQRPSAKEIVTVRYSGWTTDGELFDSSLLHGRPAVLPLPEIIPGLREGLMGMVPGEQRRLWVPEALAYDGAEDAPAGMLVFDVELVSFRAPPAPLPAPPVPADVKAPPTQATRSSTGLATRVLRPGSGTTRPGPTATVEVHYAGWTTDGKMFDNSYERGEPTRFALDTVIAGWTEGVQLMLPGEKRRLWIPESLAYRGLPGAPAGMLVFDVELLRIVPDAEARDE